MKVLQFPLARITLFFIAGILLSHGLEPKPLLLFGLLSVVSALFAVFFYLAKRNIQLAPYFGSIVFVVAFLLGIITSTVHNPLLQSDHYLNLAKSSKFSNTFYLTLRERLKSTQKNQRYVALVRAVDGKKSAGRLLVNFKKNAFSEVFPIGTQLKLNGKLELPRKPDNPEQFDYGRYLSNKSVHAQLYVRGSPVAVSQEPKKDVFYYSDLIRCRILQNLKKAHFNKKELAVVAALILGQQQDIAPEILKDYQFAGAIHILSVSGLHVGFILLFVNLLLKKLPNNRINSFIKLIIVFCSLWGFAILSGLSPSVVRSATMFSFVALGQHLGRKTNMFHTLLVSMFLILIFEPNFLFDIGFQLSYLALFFILWLQPLIGNLWQPKYKVISYLWDILTVSLAAQMGTLPLSLFYFHQFPGLFFITNLIILPFLSVIMALGVIVMVLAVFNYTPSLLAKLLEWSISLLDAIIAWIASFEQFILQNIPFNFWMLLSLYLLIILVTIAFEKPGFERISIAMIAIVLFQSVCFGSRWDNHTQSEWIVFNARKSSLIVNRNGETVHYYSNAPNDSLLLKPYLTACFNKKLIRENFKSTDWCQNQKVLLIDSLGYYPKNVNPDIVLLRQSPKVNIERMLNIFQPKLIIADGSNFKLYIARWKLSCLQRKIPFHATAEKGFYRLKN